MTEESGGSDDEITRHKLPWRSESKNFVPYTYMHVRIILFKLVYLYYRSLKVYSKTGQEVQE